MNKIHMKSYLGLAILTSASFLFSQTLRAQEVDLETAIYGSDSTDAGSLPNTSGTDTLSTVKVNQVYTSSTGYTQVYVGDSSGVDAYIYVPSGTTSSFIAGDSYTGLVVDLSVYQGNEELELDTTNPASTLAPTATGTPTYTPISEGLTTTSTALTGAYSTTQPLDLEPVQFTFTAPATQVVANGGSAKLTDPVTGDLISFYHPETTLSFTLGQTYTVDGIEEDYAGDAEIYGPSATVVASTPPTGAPEPSTLLLMGLSAVGLLWGYSRRGQTV